jgi:hypothetical protein
MSGTGESCEGCPLVELKAGAAQHVPRSEWLLPALVGAVVWIIGAIERSFWLDEFHTLQHARAAPWSEFFASVSADNHPPLSFLLAKIARSLLGESELALRSWSILAGLATVFLAARIGARTACATSRAALPWLVVLSSFAFNVFSEARMYGLLALATAGVIDSVLACLEGKRRHLLVATWVAVGCHTHYYFAYELAALGLLGVGVWLRSASARASVTRLFAAAALGVAAFVPWIVVGLAEQLANDLPSGGSTGRYASFAGYVMSLGHLLFLNASLGGEWVSRYVALPGVCVGGLLGVLGFVRLARGARSTSVCSRTSTALFHLAWVSALVAPAIGLCVAFVLPRAGFNWRYVAGALVPVLVFVAAGVRAKPWYRLALGGVLAATLALVLAVNVLSPGPENFRGAFRYIAEHARAGDAMIVTPLQVFRGDEALDGWDYYGPRVQRELGLDGSTSPTLYQRGAFEGALEHERVWIYVRKRYEAHILAALRERYTYEEGTGVDDALSVYLFADPRR